MDAVLSSGASGPRPAELCRELLAALDAADGRSRRRKRDQRPDQIGLSLKRELLEAAVEEDPAPEDFEAWLLHRTLSTGRGSGGVRAMALSIFDEWRLASVAPSFRQWLDQGAPSDDKLAPHARRAAGEGETG